MEKDGRNGSLLSRSRTGAGAFAPAPSRAADARRAGAECADPTQSRAPVPSCPPRIRGAWWRAVPVAATFLAIAIAVLPATSWFDGLLIGGLDLRASVGQALKGVAALTQSYRALRSAVDSMHGTADALRRSHGAVPVASRRGHEGQDVGHAAFRDHRGHGPAVGSARAGDGWIGIIGDGRHDRRENVKRIMEFRRPPVPGLMGGVPSGGRRAEFPADRATAPTDSPRSGIWQWGGLLLAALAGAMAYRMAASASTRRRGGEEEGGDVLRCRQVLDDIGAGTWDCDFAERTVRWDGRCARILDMGQAPWTTDRANWPLLVHPEDVTQVDRAFEAAVLFGTSLRVECRMRTAGDVWRWVELRGGSAGRHGSAAAGLSGTLTDISARKKDELVLRERDGQSRRLLASLPEAVIVLDTDGRIKECHLPVAEEHCWSRLCALGQEYEKAWPADTADTLTRAIGEAMATGRPVRKRLQSASEDGGCDAEMTVSVLGDEPGNPLGFLCLLRDVTELRRVEDRARSSETLASDLVDSLSAHVAVLDRHGIVRAANVAWREFSSVAGNDLRPRVGEDYLACCRGRSGCEDGVESEAALVGIRAVLTGISPDFHMEYRVPVVGGARWFAMRVSPLRSAAGGVVMAHEDVTARKRAENAAREVFLRVHRIAAQLPGVLFQCRRLSDGRYSFPYMSDGARQVFGLEPESLRHDGTGWLARVEGEDLPRVQAALEASADSGNPWSQQFRLRDAAGMLRWFAADAVCETDGDCVVWNGFMADVTHRRLADDRIWNSERAARERFRTLPVAGFSLDCEGGVLEANDRWRLLAGVDAEDPCGRPMFDYLVSADRGVLADLLGRLRAGGEARATIRFRRPDGGVAQTIIEGVAEFDGMDPLPARLVCIAVPTESLRADGGHPARRAARATGGARARPGAGDRRH